MYSITKNIKRTSFFLILIGIICLGFGFFDSISSHVSDKDIKYKYVYKKEDDPIELIEWTYEDHMFHLDKETNIVYEHGTDIAIGKKVYKDGKYIIKDLYKWLNF